MKAEVIDEYIPYQVYKICVMRVNHYINARSDSIPGLAAQINKDLSAAFPDYKAKVMASQEIFVLWETAAAKTKPVIIRIANHFRGGEK